MESNCFTEAHRFYCQILKAVSWHRAAQHQVGSPAESRFPTSPASVVTRAAISSDFLAFQMWDYKRRDNQLWPVHLQPSPCRTYSRHLSCVGTLEVSKGLSITLLCRKVNNWGSSGCLLAGNFFLDDLIGIHVKGMDFRGTRSCWVRLVGLGFHVSAFGKCFCAYQCSFGCGKHASHQVHVQQLHL